MTRALAAAFFLTACGSSPSPSPAGFAGPVARPAASAVTATSTATSTATATATSTWVNETSSPGPNGTSSFPLSMAKCGREDARLSIVARELATADETGARDLSRTTEALRRAGVPQVWPRVWLGTAEAEGRDTGPAKPAGASSFDDADVAKRVSEWRGAIPTVGERRCGVSGVVTSHGKQALVFVTVDALADLAPLSTHAHVGAWLKVDATLLVAATSARVVVVGPAGRPHAVPSSLDRGHIRATFAPDRAGRFAVQVLGDVGQGPRPLVEAVVFADVEPYEDASSAPGETAAQGESGAAALARMVLALRSELGLGPLRRDPELDKLADAHARAMKASGRVGHDVGDGDPKTRVLHANLALRQVGENVAHAESVVHAHRALYASPSHRENLIHPEFDRFGLAVLPDADGTVWVSEMFAR